MPGALGAAHGQAHRLHAAVAPGLHDVGIHLGHALGQAPAQFDAEQLAHLGPRRHRFHTGQQGLADDLRPQRIAVVVGPAQAQQRAHVGIQLTQLPLAGMLDRQAEAVGFDAGFHLVVVHQAQGLPGGGGRSARGLAAGRGFARHLMVQRVVEGMAEGGLLAVQLELGRQEVVALMDAQAGECGQAQAVHAALRRLTGGMLDAQGRSLQRGVGTRKRRIHDAHGDRGGTRQATAWRAGCLMPRISASMGATSTPCRGGQRLSASRISRSSFTSSGSGAGAAGAGSGSDRRRRLICLTITKMTKARIRKLSATVRKLP